MSIYDKITFIANTPSQTYSLGESVSHALYSHPLDILLSGTLGAGKTLFAQGFAKGYGIDKKVQSPSFGLVHDYDKLAHIDLYRLKETEANEILLTTHQEYQIRLIEWPERASKQGAFAQACINIRLEDVNRHTRTIDIFWKDVPIPEEQERRKWIEECAVPIHIQRHMSLVTKVAMECADAIIKNGIAVRKEALKAGAQLHDLFRFVDFKQSAMTGFHPTSKQMKIWKKWKEKYNISHEKAAEIFLREQGYDAIGKIIASHGSPEKCPQPKTTEQKILAYSDKRVKFDTIVSLDERFDDFIERYGRGKESQDFREWRKKMKELERELFGEKPPM